MNQTQPFIVDCRSGYHILPMFFSKLDDSLAISGSALCDDRVLLACLTRGWSSCWFAKTASGECCADQSLESQQAMGAGGRKVGVIRSTKNKLSRKPLGFISGPTPKGTRDWSDRHQAPALPRILMSLAVRHLGRGSASVTTPPSSTGPPAEQPSNLQPAAIHLFISCSTTTTAFHCCPCVR